MKLARYHIDKAAEIEAEINESHMKATTKRQ